MTDFEIREQIGRDYALSWLNDIQAENIQFSTGLYDNIDVDFNYKNVDITAEIKVRDIKYKNYNTHFLELYKYIKVMEYATVNNKSEAVYLNFFGDCWLYVYKLSQIDITEISKIWLVATTSENNGFRKKDIIEIPSDIAQIFHRETVDDRWIKIK